MTQVDSNSRTALVVLCGLPGAGKTSLCRALAAHMETEQNCKIACNHVCFDDVLQDMLTDGQGFSPELWRAGRQAALHRIQRLLAAPPHDWPTGASSAHLSAADLLHSDRNAPGARGIRGQQAASTTNGLPSPAGMQQPLRGVVLADDNNYYESMRQQLFRMAAAAGAACLQLHVACSPATAAARNAARPAAHQVPPHVLQHMAEQFEPPRAGSSSGNGSSGGGWQGYLATLHVDSEQPLPHASQLLSLIESSWGAPAALPPPAEEAAALRAAARQLGRAANAASVSHQLDLWSRRLVSEAVSRHDPAVVGCDRGAYAQRLNVQRKALLQQAAVHLQQQRAAGEEGDGDVTIDVYKQHFVIDCLGLQSPGELHAAGRVT